MKNIKIYLYVAAALVLTGCNFLDIDPKGKVIASTTSEYRALLTSGYSQYPKIMGRGYTAMLSDEIGIFRADQIIGNSDREGMPRTYTWQYTAGMFDFEWLSYYNTIFHANVILEQVKDALVDGPETREQLIAEAYALRAYCHFELLNLYGKWYDPATAATDRGIPIADHNDIEQQYVPASVARVYAFILEDIENSLKNMEVEKQTALPMTYRFSEMAVKALESRVKLYMGDWQGAYDAATAVMPAYTLVDFNTISPVVRTDARLPWKAGSTENILALDNPFGGLSGDFVSLIGMLSDEILDLFDAEDIRSHLIEEIWELDWDTWEDVYMGTKLLRLSDDKCSFRVAELYLTAAESAANIGTPAMLAEAKTLLLDLQRTRFTPAGYDAKAAAVGVMNAPQLLQEIMDERGREFLMEGHRWFDLRRTSRPQITKSYGGSEHVLRQNDPRYTVAYPRSAVEGNPNLAN